MHLNNFTNRTAIPAMSFLKTLFTIINLIINFLTVLLGVS